MRCFCAGYFLCGHGTKEAPEAVSVDEIANMVVYVSSHEASVTNGAALRAEGGVVQTIT